jgi:hypothetical protein
MVVLSAKTLRIVAAVQEILLAARASVEVWIDIVAGLDDVPLRIGGLSIPPLLEQVRIDEQAQGGSQKSCSYDCFHCHNHGRIAEVSGFSAVDSFRFRPRYLRMFPCSQGRRAET